MLSSSLSNIFTTQIERRVKMCQVLIVDDDPVHHYLAQYLCKNHSAISSLKCFLKPADALDFITKEVLNKSPLPQVVLLDINMPDIDGWKFLESLQNICKSAETSINIFMLSSAPHFKTEQLRMQYHFVKGYYTKPLTKNMLDRLLLSEYHPTELRNI